MTQKERMKKEMIYDPADEEILREQTACAGLLKEYNALGLGDEARMTQLMQEMFAEVGEGCFIQPPFYANWAGKNVHLGKKVYANFNLTLVDDADIYIGDMTMIAPNVTISTGTHPILPALRDRADDRKRLLHHFGSRVIGVLRLCLCGRLTAEQVGHGFHRVLQCFRVAQQRGKHIVFHAKASLFAENVPQLSGKPRTLGCLHEFLRCLCCAAHVTSLRGFCGLFQLIGMLCRQLLDRTPAVCGAERTGKPFECCISTGLCRKSAEQFVLIHSRPVLSHKKLFHDSICRREEKCVHRGINCG